jgi:hypothetical protein
MANSANYNRDYYEKNKDRIAKRKASRYKLDMDYRKQVLVRRAEQREREKEERAEAEANAVPRTQRPGKRMRITLPDGERVVTEMLSIGKMAHRLRISTQTLRKWERLGVMPQAIYSSKGGHRLYTTDQAVTLKDVYEKYKRKYSRWELTDEFIEAVHTAWRNLNGGVQTT